MTKQARMRSQPASHALAGAVCTRQQKAFGGTDDIL